MVEDYIPAGSGWITLTKNDEIIALVLFENDFLKYKSGFLQYVKIKTCPMIYQQILTIERI